MIQPLFKLMITLAACLLFIVPTPAVAQETDARIAELLAEAENELHRTIWKSLAPATRALELAEMNQNALQIAESQLMLARACIGINELEKALELLLPALSTFQQLGARDQEAQARRRLGGLYVKLEDYDRARSELETALSIFEELQDKEGMSATFNSLGVFHGNSGNLTIALDYYEQALDCFSDLKNTAGIATAHINIGEIYRMLGQYERALPHFDKSLELSESSEFRQGIAGALVRRAKLQLESGELDKAWDDAANAEKIASGAGLLDRTLDALKIMTTIREQQGLESDAARCREKSRQLEAQLAEKREVDRIAQIEAQYRVRNQGNHKENPESTENTSPQTGESNKLYLIVFPIIISIGLAIAVALFLLRSRNK